MKFQNEEEFRNQNKYKILFVPTLNKSVAFYRFEQYVEQMRKHSKDGVSVAYFDEGLPEDQTCQWEWKINTDNALLTHLVELAKFSDIVIFQSIHSQAASALIHMLKDEFKCTIISEFDDDPYSVSGNHPYYEKLCPGSNVELWADDQIRTSDFIIASTPYMKSKLKKKNRKVNVIPNAIDFAMWDAIEINEPRKDDLVYIGWSGGGNHSDDFDIINKPINYILDKYDNVRFVINVGGEIPEYFKRDKVIQHDMNSWHSIYKYPTFLKNLQFDIGVAPLRDRDFNRAKTNLKWLEYSAMSIPTIASDICTYQDTTSVLCKTEQEWIFNLEKYINDKDLRQKLGNKSYKYAKKVFNVKKVANDYLSLLKKIIDGGFNNE